jgi:hypothetical protein
VPRQPTGTTLCGLFQRYDPDDVEIIDGYEVESGPYINDAEFDEMHRIFADGHFSRFLASAANLQTLVINMPELGSTQLRPVNLANVVGRLHFPQLRAFSLARVQTTLQGLGSFLLHHKDSLAEVRLCDLYLPPNAGPDEQDWQDFFVRVGGQLPRLGKVSLRGGFHDVRGNLDYVFGDGLSEYVGTRLSRAMEEFMLHGGHAPPSPDAAEYREPDRIAGRDRTELFQWAGEALVPEIRPIGWHLGWEM